MVGVLHFKCSVEQLQLVVNLTRRITLLNTGLFKPGQHVNLDGDLGMIRLFDKDLAVIDLKMAGVQTFVTDKLLQKYKENDLILLNAATAKPRYIEALTQREINQIKRREKYLYALDKYEHPNGRDNREKVIDKISAEIEDDSAPSPKTLSRWYKEWIESNKDTGAQIIKGDSKRLSRIDPEIRDLMNDVIDEIYMQKNGATVSKTYDVFTRRYTLRKYLVKPPSLATMQRIIKSIEPIAVIAARQGVTEARAAARIANKMIEKNFVLDRVEIDTAHFNIGLLNKDGYYVGKPSIYFVIDSFSRAILGFCVHIGKGKESSAGVIHALTHAVGMKQDHQAYPMCGVMQKIVRDSGPGYRAAHTQEFLSKVAHTVEVSKTRQGWGKPFVERFIGTARERFFKGLKGYRGKYDPNKYAEDTLSKSASITVQEFYDRLYDFIVYDYHHTEHKGLKGKTPYNVWMSGAYMAHPPSPDEIEDLKLMRALPQQRTLHRTQGIDYMYERFHSEELAYLFDDIQASTKIENKKKVSILVNPQDASAITVVSPITGHLINVPNVDSAAGTQSFTELKAFRNPDNRINEEFVETRFAVIESDFKEVKVRKKKNKSGTTVTRDDETNAPLSSVLDDSHVMNMPNRARSNNDGDEDEINFDFE